MAARLAHTQKVVGSSPTPATNSHMDYFTVCSGAYAHMRYEVWRFLRRRNRLSERSLMPGSIPARRSMVSRLLPNEKPGLSLILPAPEYNDGYLSSYTVKWLDGRRTVLS